MNAFATTTSGFVIHALPEDDLDRIRRTGIDDFGHSLVAQVNDEEPGAPLRCCLREAGPGEEIALIAWRPLREAPDSVYAEVGPVYVHMHPCPGYPDEDRYPAGFRHRPQVLRSYSAAGDMLQAVITDGHRAERAIAELFADPRAVVLHSRNVKAGCYMFAVHPG